MMGRLARVPYQGQAGDFRLMSRRVVDTVRSMPERRRFLRGMVAWVGFKQIPIEYRRAGRAKGGGASYPALFRLALEALTSFSDVPLNLATYLGAFAATVTAVAGATLLGLTLLGVITASFSLWILVAVLLLGGVQLMSVGVLGRYLAHVREQVLDRPLYLVDRVVMGHHAHELGPAVEIPAVEIGRTGAAPPATDVRRLGGRRTSPPQADGDRGDEAHERERAEDAPEPPARRGVAQLDAMRPGRDRDPARDVVDAMDRRAARPSTVAFHPGYHVSVSTSSEGRAAEVRTLRRSSPSSVMRASPATGRAPSVPCARPGTAASVTATDRDGNKGDVTVLNAAPPPWTTWRSTRKARGSPPGLR